MTETHSPAKELERLLRSGHRLVRICTNEESRALGVAVAAAHRLDKACIAWDAVRGLSSPALSGSKHDTDNINPVAGMLRLATKHADDLCVLLDSSAYLKDDPRALRTLRHLIDRCRAKGGAVLLIDHDAAPPAFVETQAVQMHLLPPGAPEIERIIRSVVRNGLGGDPDTSRVEARVSRATLDLMIKNLQGLTADQIERAVAEAVVDDNTLDTGDLNHLLAVKRRELGSAGVLEHVETPASLDQVGGLVHLKGWLAARRDAFGPEAESFGLTPPRGVLLLGVQGAGKSLCAKAISTAWSRPLLRLDPGALYDRFVGATEQRLREALAQAEAMAPVVLWIDEIEKGFASAAAQSTDGGLSQRVFGRLLTWMQEHDQPVFLVATANNVEALPPELLRKGRFDEIFFVDLPGAEARKAIIDIHLGSRGRDPESFDVGAIVEATEGYSGAEIEQAIIAALYDTYPQRRNLKTEDVLAAVASSPPLSVTRAEQVNALRHWASSRCSPAG